MTNLTSRTNMHSRGVRCFDLRYRLKPIRCIRFLFDDCIASILVEGFNEDSNANTYQECLKLKRTIATLVLAFDDSFDI